MSYIRKAILLPYGNKILGNYPRFYEALLKFDRFFCIHKWKFGYIFGLSDLVKYNIRSLPTMIFDKSFARCYCSKCGKILAEEEFTFDYFV